MSSDNVDRAVMESLDDLWKATRERLSTISAEPLRAMDWADQGTTEEPEPLDMHRAIDAFKDYHSVVLPGYLQPVGDPSDPATYIAIAARLEPGTPYDVADEFDDLTLSTRLLESTSTRALVSYVDTSELSNLQKLLAIKFLLYLKGLNNLSRIGRELYSAHVPPFIQKIRASSGESQTNLIELAFDILAYAESNSVEKAVDRLNGLIVQNSDSAETPRELPESAPMIYSGGKESGRPSEFLTRVWEPYLAAGLLYQHYLKRLDPKLKEALDNEFKGRRSELRQLIPTQEDETDQLLHRHRLAEIQGPERGRVASAIRRARGLTP